MVAGDGATCVRSKGDLKCWGNAPAVPAAIAGKVAEVGLGHDIHCARLDGGEVTCWGGKATGTVAVGAPARALAVAPYQGAAVRADGKVMFWWLESTTPPKQVSLVDPARVMCAGHCCALGKDGSVLCWGDNLMGQLGNPDQGLGGSTEVPTPVAL